MTLKTQSHYIILKLIRQLDWWALYTMHSEIVKYSRDPESMARKFVNGYKKQKE